MSKDRQMLVNAIRDLQCTFKYITVALNEEDKEIEVTSYQSFPFTKTAGCASRAQANYIYDLATACPSVKNIMKLYSKQCISKLINFRKEFDYDLILN